MQTVKKTNRAKIWSFEKINTINKTPSNTDQEKKKEKTQITYIRGLLSLQIPQTLK